MVAPIDAAATLAALRNQCGKPERAWLDALHPALEAAAYPWPAGLPDDEILLRLLALNHERSALPAIPRHAAIR